MFFTVNPSGAATNTINGSLDFISDGLAVFNGGLFYTDIQFPNSDILTQIDPTTGTSTLIGSGLGYEVFAGTTVSSTIYGIGLDAEATPALLRIDPGTGSATYVASITGMTAGADPFALAYDPAPEPSTICLVGLILPVGLAVAIRRRRYQGR